MDSLPNRLLLHMDMMYIPYLSIHKLFNLGITKAIFSCSPAHHGRLDLGTSHAMRFQSSSDIKPILLQATALTAQSSHLINKDTKIKQIVR